MSFWAPRVPGVQPTLWGSSMAETLDSLPLRDSTATDAWGSGWTTVSDPAQPAIAVRSCDGLISVRIEFATPPHPHPQPARDQQPRETYFVRMRDE